MPTPYGCSSSAGRKVAGWSIFFVGIQVITMSGGWVNVEYYDCCHGHCHLHTQNGEQPQGIAQLDNVDDVRRAFAQVSRDADVRARIIRDSQGE